MEQIRHARKSKGWTQEQLANAIGVKRAVISKYESGAISPSMDMIKSIADALDVDIVSLIAPEDVQLPVFMSILDKKLLELVKLDYSSSLDFYEAFLRKEISIMMLNNDIDRQLQRAYGQLNQEGQRKAVERVEELTEIPRYRRPETPSGPIRREREGKDTPGSAPPSEAPKNCE